MNAISNIRSMLGNGANGDIEFSSGHVETSNRNNLKSAMNAADRLLGDVNEIKKEAKKEFETTFLKEIADVAKDNVAKEGGPMETPIENIEDTVIDTDTKTDIDLTQTERSMELGRKKLSLQEMRSKIQNSATVLHDLAMQSDTLLEYFAKAQVELAHLEEVEAKSEKMQEIVASVSERHKEMKLKISEQQKQIELLVTLKSKNRNTIEQARSEINKLQADAMTQAGEIKSRDNDIAKLKSERSALAEKNAQLATKITETEALVEQQNEKIDALSLELHEKEQAIAKKTHTIATLTEAKETAGLEVKDIQARYDTLTAKYAEAQSALEDESYEFKSELKGLEEKLRHRDNRIVKLESSLEVTKQQLVKTEERMANLVYELENSKSDKDVKTLQEVARAAKSSASKTGEKEKKAAAN